MGPSWTWAPTTPPPVILVPVHIWQLDQEWSAGTRLGVRGQRKCHTTWRSAPPPPAPLPHDSIVAGHMCQKRGTGRTLSQPCGLGPVPHSPAADS